MWVLTGFACYSARKSRSYRPGSQKMLAGIEAGHVEVVITKDFSRLGRNSSLTGLYINYTFPQYDVRYIAINDHFDTIDPNSTDSDMAGIKNWFNEWYSKDTSRKIRAVVLKQIVWKHIQEVISVVTRYEAYFRSEMEQKLRMQSEESLRLYQKRLAQAEKRIGELDRLFIRIYEDNVAGWLDDERFAMMSKNYTEEQKDLKAEVKGLQQQIHEQEQQAENIEQFVQRVKRNSTVTELTPYALRELVKAVYVDAPDKSSGKRRQKVHIEYDLVGYIPVDELLKAEQA